MQEERLPSFPALMGLACYKCFKDENVTLSRCSVCLRVVYCSPECQKLDWTTHKRMCKALSAIAKSNASKPRTYLSRLPSEPTNDLTVVNSITDDDADYNLHFCNDFLGRSPNALEVMLIVYEPRCMVCARTDNLIRIEAADNDTTADIRRLIPCSKCNLSFCCSPAHWEAARLLHDAPCEDGRHDVSQCQMNCWVREQAKLAPLLAAMHDASGQLMKVPLPLKSAWTSLTRLSWEGELGNTLDPLRRVRSAGAIDRLQPPWLRLASESLSRAMTILYGLEKMNDDAGWTRKHTLTIHIIGATTPEATPGKVFEEILHRLPEVNTLKLVFCGQAMPGSRNAFECEICAECKRLGRKHIHEYSACTYHEFVQTRGSKFKKPDLCIAFNSGAHQVEMYPWPATLRLLVGRKIPALFTSYNREEAEADAAQLRAAGATLQSGLGPAKNPWGSIHATPASSRVYGWHAVNGWLAGGFK
ncbi:hypothetical protein FB451DRAFT_1231594 [Mycena latifolia]|nr:hypothetical protein FB451DRAFT_1231594 [Mycena latifolia]